jgi:hypothetical protein
MALFQSKQQKEINAALTELSLLMEEDFREWDKRVKITITARKASEFPVETLEPVLRNLWVECMVRSILLSANAESKYKELVLRVPSVASEFPVEVFNLRLSNQRKEMGFVLGSVVHEICNIKPDYESTLGKHLEEPELTKIKEEAKKVAKDYLEE